MSDDNNSLGLLEKIIARFRDTLEILPGWQRLAGLVALCVLVIVVVAEFRIDNSNHILAIVLVGLAVLLVIIVGSRRMEGINNVKRNIDKVPKGKDQVVAILKGAAENTSRALGVEQVNIRSNIFMPSSDANGFLKIPDGFHYNMNDANELTVKIPQGYGCSGNAFSSKEPTIAILEKDWGKHAIDDMEFKKVNPNLQWIISMPIPSPEKRDEIIGVLNVDCLNIRQDKTDIERVVADIWAWGNVLSYLL